MEEITWYARLSGCVYGATRSDDRMPYRRDSVRGLQGQGVFDRISFLWQSGHRQRYNTAGLPQDLYQHQVVPAGIGARDLDLQDCCKRVHGRTQEPAAVGAARRWIGHEKPQGKE